MTNVNVKTECITYMICHLGLAIPEWRIAIARRAKERKRRSGYGRDIRCQVFTLVIKVCQ